MEGKSLASALTHRPEVFVGRRKVTLMRAWCMWAAEPGIIGHQEVSLGPLLNENSMLREDG